MSISAQRQIAVQEAITAYWDDRAPGYDAYQQRPERRDLDARAWADIWAAALPAPPHDARRVLDVLDVGTGSGHAAHVIAGLGHRVTGIDLSAEMLALARAHEDAQSDPPPDFRLGDAVAPPFKPGSFDAVVGRYVMWTLREPVTALRNWRRLLRPEGVVAVADSTWFAAGRHGSEDLDGLYGGAERALPLAAAATIDDTATALREAGLHDVRVTALERVRELDAALGVAPGHEVSLQFMVTGRGS